MRVKEKGQNRKVPGRIIKNNVSGRNYVKDIRYRHTCILCVGFVCVCVFAYHIVFIKVVN